MNRRAVLLLSSVLAAALSIAVAGHKISSVSLRAEVGDVGDPNSGSGDTPQATRPEEARHSGIVEGTIIYDADDKRPWRYARYYVKDRKIGELAEAVVCLKSTKLRNLSPPEKPETVVVDQKDYRFIPETVALRAGGRIKFTNSDPQHHNVSTTDGAAPFNVNMFQDGEHVQLFPRAGSTKRPVRIGCVFHSTMHAWVFVFDHPYYQITAADGRFRLENVPPGEYRLEMAHPAGGLYWEKPIVVEPDATLQTDIHVSPDHLTGTKS